MSSQKFGIVVALALAALLVMTPTQAVNYTVGVSAGQWIKYGNFVATGTGIPSSISNQTDWFRIDVVSVSGTNVTVHISGKYKNGTNVAEMGAIVDVAKGTSNATGGSGYFLFIIPANLAQNDVIPTSGLNFVIRVNQTESKTYLGTSRNVNVFNLTASYPNVATYKWITVWDKSSGMLLEMNLSLTSIGGSIKVSFNATDTNIFATSGGTGTSPDYTPYIIIAIVVVIIIVIAGIAMMMRRRKPPATTTPETKEPTTS